MTDVLMTSGGFCTQGLTHTEGGRCGETQREKPYESRGPGVMQVKANEGRGPPEAGRKDLATRFRGRTGFRLQVSENFCLQNSETTNLF